MEEFSTDSPESLINEQQHIRVKPYETESKILVPMLPPMLDTEVRDAIMIEVFVRSSSVHMDVATVREMTQHTYCAPGTGSTLLKNAASQFKGRVLPQDDYTVLERIGELAYELHEDVKVYDVLRALDRMRAVRHGIMKTPAVVVQGKKHEGLDNILALLP